jgi:hypothetical protein
MNTPVRTTLVVAFLSAIVSYPLSAMIIPVLGWPSAPKIVFSMMAAVYAILLARWSRTRLMTIAFPLAILLGVALWPQGYTGFFLVLMGTLAWVRSGICFQKRPVRAFLAELVTIGGGTTVLGVLSPSGPLEWSLGIWLFGLIQSLYFFVVLPSGKLKEGIDRIDPFDAARRDLEQLLNRSW